MKKNHILISTFLASLFLLGNVAIAQSSANYTFSTGTAGNLATDRNGNTVTPAGSLVTTNTDDGSSSVTAIGFDFYFMGTLYTYFSVSSNGVLQLHTTSGATAVSSTLYGNATNFPAATPFIAPYWGDLTTLGTAVQSVVTGSSPNRCLAVQWKNVGINYASTTNDGTFQLRLYETSGIIEFVYGAMAVGSTSTPASSKKVVIGFCDNTTTNHQASCTQANPPVSSASTTTVNNNNSTGNISGYNTSTATARRTITYIPPGSTGNSVATTLNNPTAMTFSAVTNTTTTVSWTVPGTTTGILGYALYRSTNGGTTYTYVNSYPGSSTATAGAQTGLTAGTNYTWKVVSYSEGGLSTGLTGSQYTSPLSVSTSGPLAFGSVLTNTPSTTQSFTFSGTNMTSFPANVTITAPANFEVSTTSSSSGFGSTATKSYSSATLSSTTVWVRVNTATPGSYSGNITFSGPYGGSFSSYPTVSVTATAVNGCSGTPTAGSISSTTANPICGSGSTTLSLTGASTQPDLTYQWQSATSSGGVYIDIGGATSATYATGTLTPSSAAVFFKCRLTCPTGGATATTASPYNVQVYSVPSTPAPTSNTPYCASTNINLSANTSATSYSWTGPNNFTSTSQNPTISSATAAAAGTYSLAVTNNGCTSAAGTTVVALNTSASGLAVTPSTVTICNGSSTSLVASQNTTNTTASGTINLTVTDNTAAGVNSVLAVSGIPTNATVTKIEVTLNVTMTFDGDLIFNLKAPNGNIINLINQQGSSGANFTNTVVSSAGGTAFSSGSAPFTGTFTASLGSNVGPTSFKSNVTAWTNMLTASNGNWTLAVNDNAAADVAVINNWSIKITYAAATVTWSPTTNLYTNAGLTIPYTTASGATTVYAAPTNGTTYTATACASTATGAVTVIKTAISATPTNPTTCSGTNGSIVLSGLTDGILYTVNYSKNGVAQSPLSLTAASGAVTMSSLGAGSYTNITVTASGCTTAAPASATISDPAAPSISSSSSVSPTTCLGTNGTITLNGLTASTTYTVNYTKNGAPATPASIASNGSGTLVITGLGSGTYASVNVTLPATGCTSGSVGAFVLSDPATPAISSSSSTSPSTCSGTDGTITLNGLTATTTYTVNFTKNGTAQTPASIMSDGSGTVVMTGLSAGSYSSVSVTLAACTSNTVGTFTLSNPPTPSISSSSSSNPTTCTGTEGYITLNGLNASTTYTVNYNKNSTPAIPASIAADGSGVLTITGLNAGTYSAVTVTLAACVSGAAGPFTLTDPTPPSISASNNGPVCYNTAISVGATTVGGATYSWTGPNSFSSSAQNPSVTAHATNAEAGIYSVTATVNNCTSNVATTTVVVNPNAWTGAVDNDWNNAGNWCGGVPTSAMPISIPSGTPHDPTLPSSTTITNTSITVANGAAISVPSGSTLSVTGDVVVNGTIEGDGNVVMQGTVTQTITGTGTVANLELNNSAGATISSGNTLNVTGVLTLTSGDLTTNNGLVLVSDASGSGSIGAIASGTITGNVNIQRYIPGGRRCYRFFAHPYNSSIALNPELTSRVDVTGPGGAANGFTPTQTNNASAFWYNPLSAGNNSVNGNDTGWKQFNSANATSGVNSWQPYQGVRVLVRGTPGQGLSGGTYTPSAVTLQTFGNVNTGDQTMTLHKGANGINYNVMGNPYPSAVNLRPVLYAAKQAGNLAGSSYWIWDATAGTVGAYVTYPISNNSVDDYFLPMNAAFTVSAAYNNATITFHETDKVASAAGGVFRTNSAVAGRVEFKVLSNNDSIFWDRMFTMFDDNATTAKDDKDGDKATNPGVNLYTLGSDNNKLSIDARPFVNNMVIPVGIKVPTLQQYKLKVANMNLPTNYHLYLIDNYLNIVQPLQAGTEYMFDVTTDSTSQGEGRFVLNGAIDATTTTGVTTTATNNKSIKISVIPNPATDNTNITFDGVKAGTEAGISITNVNGQEVYGVHVADASVAKVNVPLSTLASGIYMVTVTCGTQVMTERLVKK